MISSVTASLICGYARFITSTLDTIVWRRRQPQDSPRDRPIIWCIMSKWVTYITKQKRLITKCRPSRDTCVLMKSGWHDRLRRPLEGGKTARFAVRSSCCSAMTCMACPTSARVRKMRSVLRTRASRASGDRDRPTMEPWKKKHSVHMLIM